MRTLCFVVLALFLAAPARAAQVLVTAQWTDTCIGEDGFEVWQPSPQGPHVLKVCSTGPNGTTCGGSIDQANGQCVTVRCFQGTTFGPDSDQACLTPNVQLNKPTNVVFKLQ